MGTHFARTDEAIAMATTWTARHMHAEAIVALTESGNTGLLCRARRRRSRSTPSPATSARAGAWRCPQRLPIGSRRRRWTPQKPSEEALALLRDRGVLKPGVRVLLTKGDFTGQAGGTNTMKVLHRPLKEAMKRHVVSAPFLSIRPSRARGHAPENTLLSSIPASPGRAHVEIDVQRHPSGAPAGDPRSAPRAHHHGKGRVRKCSLDYIRSTPAADNRCRRWRKSWTWSIARRYQHRVEDRRRHAEAVAQVCQVLRPRAGPGKIPAFFVSSAGAGDLRQVAPEIPAGVLLAACP